MQTEERLMGTRATGNMRSATGGKTTPYLTEEKPFIRMNVGLLASWTKFRQGVIVGRYITVISAHKYNEREISHLFLPIQIPFND